MSIQIIQIYLSDINLIKLNSVSVGHSAVENAKQKDLRISFKEKESTRHNTVENAKQIVLGSVWKTI